MALMAGSMAGWLLFERFWVRGSVVIEKIVFRLIGTGTFKKQFMVVSLNVHTGCGFTMLFNALRIREGGIHPVAFPSAQELRGHGQLGGFSYGPLISAMRKTQTDGD